MNDPNLDPSRMPPSLWAASAPPAPATQALAEGEHRCELLVVGGGFSGLCAALAGARRGADTMLLEAAEIGWGASGRSNGQVIPTLTRADPDVLVREFGAEHGEALVGLLRDSANTVFELIREFGIECEAVQNGWVQPAHRASRLALARSSHDQWKKRGAPVQMLSREQVAAITGSSFWHGGWLNRSGGHINPLGFARGLAGAALSQGVRVHSRSPVMGLERRGEHWLARVGPSTVKARRVILATHAYTGLCTPSPWPGLAQCIVPMRSYQMATQPLPDPLRASILPGNHAMSDTQADLHFARLDARGRLVSGGALIFAANWDARLRERIGQRLLKLYPQLSELGGVRFDHLWHGQFAATPDQLPRFHRLGDGLYTWLGCNGRGVAFASALGPVLADAALGRNGKHIALPFEAPRRILVHALVKRVAIGAMAVFRWRDGRD